VRKSFCGSLLACAAALATAEGHATLLDPSFVETSIGKLPYLTGMAWAPDGSPRLFMTTKTGTVRVMENGQLLATPFATVAPLFTSSECGLLSLAFDPDFIDNHYLYVFVTVSGTEQQIIRYTANGNVGEAPTPIMTGLPTHGVNHDGGGMAFGPDGKLYWAIGDNGGHRSGVDGDLTVLQAKVGRANPDGSVPGDNPFFDGAGPNNDYVWARGFRNPFSMTFQPATGRLWLNVVGAQREQVFTPQAGDNGGWDNYESNQPSGFLAPIISYDTNGAAARDIAATGAARSGGVVTITTSAAHRFRPGAKVTVAGVTDASFNTTAFVTSADALSFQYLQAGPDAVSGSGTATPLEIGGCVTGGAFWDSSAVPADYRGNFFFGDYVSASIVRTKLNAKNQVSEVDLWATGEIRMIDMALGPDGDMYYGSHTGALVHSSFVASAQALVVSRLNVGMNEGGKAAFSVRLAMAPPATRTVKVIRQSGDSDVSVLEGDTLSFTAANWATPQRVVLSAAQDVDSLEDHAVIRVNSSGLANELVNVRVTDDETFSIVASPSAVEVDEGSGQDLTIALTQPPVGNVELSVARTAGDASVSVSNGSSLVFSAANWSVPQTVLVNAGEDADSDDGSATLTITGAGLTPREVPVTVVDNDQKAPKFTSTPVVTAVVGAKYEYTAAASGLPTPVLSVDAGPAGMMLEPSSGLVTWTPAAEQTADVTLRAENGILPDALQTFEIVVAADQAPGCSLTLPRDGDVLSGTDAEFFGDVDDDVAATHAEFLIDGALVYDDVNDEGHFHYGGAHALFDTTLLAEGEHQLGFRGYDTAGQTCVVEVTVVVDNEPGEPSGVGGAASDGTSGEASAQAGASDGSGGSAGQPSSEAGAATADGGDATSGSAGSGASAHGSDGCGCRTAGGKGTGSLRFAGGLALLAGLVARRRRWRQRPLAR
jgi:MYXO-CTERM domain-containing protein